MTVQTVLASPKAFLTNENTNEIKFQSVITLESVRKIANNGIILHSDYSTAPWDSNSIKNLSSRERGDLAQLIKTLEIRGQLQSIKGGKPVQDDSCEVYSDIIEKEKPVNFIIIPKQNLCPTDCTLKAHKNAIHLDELTTNYIFQKAFDNKGIDLVRQGELTHVYDKFFRNLFRYTTNVEFSDRFFGVNAAGTRSDTHDVTVKWLYDKFKDENRVNGKFIFNTTTTDNERNIKKIESNCRKWLNNQEINHDHEIIIKLYYFSSKSKRNRYGYNKFPHERMIHTRQFTYEFNYGFSFAHISSGSIKLNKNKSCLVNLQSNDMWRMNIKGTLDNLCIYSILTSNDF